LLLIVRSVASPDSEWADERQRSGHEAVNEDRRPAATATRVTGDGHFSCVSTGGCFSLLLHGENEAGRQPHPKGGSNRMSILWIILIVILVLALLGFFSRGRW
jgi:hypothetical protein